MNSEGRMGDGIPQAAGLFELGARIGGYLLEDRIGQGGMAVVYRARDERLGRQVALKILTPALASDEAFRRRFVRESKMAVAVDDPHIIPVYEAGEADGVLFIAMRYVRGGDLRRLLAREGPLDPARAAAILAPVASALDAAHAAGLVHRDVKPGNMLLDVVQGRPDHVYLSDFGLSKAALGTSELTSAGQVMGTVDYASPEQLSGRPTDGQADQYALGCAAFEMLSGEPPYRRDQGLAVIYAHLSAPPPAISAVRPGLPIALDAVFERVLAKAPADRYETCTEFVWALREATGLVPPGTERPGATEIEAVRRETRPFIPGLYPSRTPDYTLPPQYSEAGQFPEAPSQYSAPSYPPAARKPNGARWRAGVLAVVAVLVAAGVYEAVTHYHPVKAAILPGHTPGASASPPASHTATPTATTTPAAPRTSSWSDYTDPSGFSVKLPPGWTEATANRSGTYPGVNFTGPEPGFDLYISWTRKPAPTALSAWQELASQYSSDPGYRQFELSNVDYRGYDAAVWEFERDQDNTLMQVIDWGFVVKPGQLAYSIELYGPAANWNQVYGTTWNGFLSGFQPSKASR